MTARLYILSYMPPCGADRAYAGTLEANNENEAFALGCAFGLFPDGDPEGYQARILEYPIGHSVRSKCGRLRLSYHPEWSFSRPWVSYKEGTAGRHYFSLEYAVQHLKQEGYRFDKASS